MQLPVASITTSSVARRVLPKPSSRRPCHVDPARMPKPTTFPDHHLPEGSVGVDPESHVSFIPPLGQSQRGAVGDTTTTGSALSAQPGESQRRPTTNTSSQLNVRERPAHTFVLPAPQSRMVAPYAMLA